MACGFYRLAVLLAVALPLLGTGACSRAEEAAGPPEAAPQGGGGARSRAPAYVPPPGGDLVARWIGKLERGRREGLQFALERLAEHPDAAGPLLANRLREVLDDPRRVGLPHNLCLALGRCGWRPAAPALVEVLQRSPVPVVRTAAAEALRDIGDPAVVPALVRQLAVEPELGPRLAILGALGRLGGPAAGAALEAAVRDWLAGRGDGEFGEEAWNNLLLLQDPEALARLRRIQELVPDTAPPLQLQLLVARLELGDRDVVADIREFLDPGRYPSGRVRALAVAGLAEAGDWDAVLEAAGDPAIVVRQAVVEALGRPEAAARDLGRDFLEATARPGEVRTWAGDDAELRIRVAACRVLRQRGERAVLDPWLRLLRGFPEEEGSAQALLLLKEEGLADPRTAPLLVRRWDHAVGEQRVDLLRALAVLRDPVALPLFREVATGDPDPDLRHLAATTVANLGPPAFPLLRDLATDAAHEELAPVALAGLGRLAREGHEASRKLLLDILADPGAGTRRRAAVAELLPRALGEAAWAPLMAVWRTATDEDLRPVLDRVLTTWY